jgi:transposase-like protein
MICVDKTNSIPDEIDPDASLGACVSKRLHYPLDVMLMCVRWYVAYGLSVRNLEEMMAERGIEVDHSTVHRWAIKNAARS